MVPMVMKSERRRLSSWFIHHRIWVQLSFLAVWLLPLGGRLHGVCAPVFHCYACPLATFACPIGVLAQFSALHVFPFIAVGVLVLVGSAFGTLVCGWACPFGLLQDAAGKIPTPKFDLPRWTGYFRYVVLVGAVLAIPYFFGEHHPLFVCRFCPAGVLEAGVPNIVKQAAARAPINIPYFFGEHHPLFVCRFCPAGVLEAGVPNIVKQAAARAPINWPNAIKLAVLGIFLVAIFFVRRPWCRIFCPLGAIFSLFNRASAFVLRLDPAACTDCKRCHRLCKFGIEPEKSPNALACIRCLECTKCGPGALKLQTIFGKQPTAVGQAGIGSPSARP